MAEITKFLFDRRFDRPVEPPRAVPAVQAVPEPDPDPEPEIPPAPTFSEQDLEDARTQGYQSGHTDALEEAGAATDRMASMAMSQVGRELEALSKTHGLALEAMAGQAARLVEVICRKMLPVTATEPLVREITGLVESILPSVLDEPRLIVRVHPDVVGPVRAHLDPLAISMGYEGRLMISPESTLGRPDCRVEWTDGGVERDTGRLWDDIREIIAHQSGDYSALPDLGDPPLPEPQPQPKAEFQPLPPDPPPAVAIPVGAPPQAVVLSPDGEWAGFDESTLGLGAAPASGGSSPVSGGVSPQSTGPSPGDGPPLQGKAQSFPFPARNAPFPSVGPTSHPFEGGGDGSPSDAPVLTPLTTGEAPFPRTVQVPSPADTNTPRPK